MGNSTLQSVLYKPPGGTHPCVKKTSQHMLLTLLLSSEGLALARGDNDCHRHENTGNNAAIHSASTAMKSDLKSYFQSVANLFDHPSSYNIHLCYKIWSTLRTIHMTLMI